MHAPIAQRGQPIAILTDPLFDASEHIRGNGFQLLQRIQQLQDGLLGV
jgi:hypothetical protein